MTCVIKPPSPIPDECGPSVFLAGSIEMGTAEDWQIAIEQHFIAKGITVFNPRRDDWDPTWEQREDNPPFREQVEWELNALDRADLILMYLQPGTKSPISLLELGLFADSGKLLVCCPDGFWRKGNVDIVCQRYSIPRFDELNKMVDYAVCSLKGWRFNR